MPTPAPGVDAYIKTDRFFPSDAPRLRTVAGPNRIDRVPPLLARSGTKRICPRRVPCGVLRRDAVGKIKRVIAHHDSGRPGRNRASDDMLKAAVRGGKLSHEVSPRPHRDLAIQRNIDLDAAPQSCLMIQVELHPGTSLLPSPGQRYEPSINQVGRPRNHKHLTDVRVRHPGENAPPRSRQIPNKPSQRRNEQDDHGRSSVVDLHLKTQSEISSTSGGELLGDRAKCCQMGHTAPEQYRVYPSGSLPGKNGG